jgi:hypothetical protein
VESNTYSVGHENIEKQGLEGGKNTDIRQGRRTRKKGLRDESEINHSPINFKGSSPILNISNNLDPQLSCLPFK